MSAEAPHVPIQFFDTSMLREDDEMMKEFNSSVRSLCSDQQKCVSKIFYKGIEYLKIERSSLPPIRISVETGVIEGKGTGQKKLKKTAEKIARQFRKIKKFAESLSQKPSSFQECQKSCALRARGLEPIVWEKGRKISESLSNPSSYVGQALDVNGIARNILDFLISLKGIAQTIAGLRIVQGLFGLFVGPVGVFQGILQTIEAHRAGDKKGVVLGIHKILSGVLNSIIGFLWIGVGALTLAMLVLPFVFPALVIPVLVGYICFGLGLLMFYILFPLSSGIDIFKGGIELQESRALKKALTGYLNNQTITLEQKCLGLVNFLKHKLTVSENKEEKIREQVKKLLPRNAGQFALSYLSDIEIETSRRVQKELIRRRLKMERILGKETVDEILKLEITGSPKEQTILVETVLNKISQKDYASKMAMILGVSSILFCFVGLPLDIFGGAQLFGVSAQLLSGLGSIGISEASSTAFCSTLNVVSDLGWAGINGAYLLCSDNDTASTRIRDAILSRHKLEPITEEHQTEAQRAADASLIAAAQQPSF